ncbi:MAG: hypothetical protein ACJAZF_003926 [Granulosicoccus sp.]|jgi:hypothetical protein
MYELLVWRVIQNPQRCPVKTVHWHPFYDAHVTERFPTEEHQRYKIG